MPLKSLLIQIQDSENFWSKVRGKSYAFFARHVRNTLFGTQNDFSKSFKNSNKVLPAFFRKILIGDIIKTANFKQLATLLGNLIDKISLLSRPEHMDWPFYEIPSCTALNKFRQPQNV